MKKSALALTLCGALLSISCSSDNGSDDGTTQEQQEAQNAAPTIESTDRDSKQTLEAPQKETAPSKVVIQPALTPDMMGPQPPPAAALSDVETHAHTQNGHIAVEENGHMPKEPPAIAEGENPSSQVVPPFTPGKDIGIPLPQTAQDEKQPTRRDKDVAAKGKTAESVTPTFVGPRIPSDPEEEKSGEEKHTILEMSVHTKTMGQSAQEPISNVAPSPRESSAQSETSSASTTVNALVEAKKSLEELFKGVQQRRLDLERVSEEVNSAGSLLEKSMLAHEALDTALECKEAVDSLRMQAVDVQMGFQALLPNPESADAVAPGDLSPEAQMKTVSPHSTTPPKEELLKGGISLTEFKSVLKKQEEDSRLQSELSGMAALINTLDEESQKIDSILKNFEQLASENVAPVVATPNLPVTPATSPTQVEESPASKPSSAIAKAGKAAQQLEKRGSQGALNIFNKFKGFFQKPNNKK